jgi:Tol biopolymer transport system component
VAPRFLPDGHRFLFRLGDGISVGDLDGSPPKPLVDGVSSAYPEFPGQLLFIQQRRLFAQSFDMNSLALTGTPSMITDNVSGSTDSYLWAVSASRTFLAYRASFPDDGRARRIAWFDRDGRELLKVGEAGGRNPSLSPNGRYVTVSRVSLNGTEVWLLDTRSGKATQLTSTGANMAALFSPTGDDVIAFSSQRNGKISLYKKVIDAASDELLLQFDDALMPSDWRRLPQGDYLLFRRNPGGTNFNIWAVPMRGNETAGAAIEVLATPAQERDAQFAPNGQWVAYESNSTGTPEIYVHPFPGPGRQIPVSLGGGVQVRWNPNGKELFYIGLDGQLMAVSIRFSPDGKTVDDVGKPQPLFRTQMGPVIQGADRQQYVVSDDGQRFLMSTVVERAPITLILNWKPGGE